MEQSHRDDKGVEEKEVRNYRVKERKKPDGRDPAHIGRCEAGKVVCGQTISNAYPDLELLYHVPNGGSRNKAESVQIETGKLGSEGRGAGFWCSRFPAPDTPDYTLN